MTGPLEFAQVRDITARIIEATNAGDFIEAEKLSLQFDAALSSIERHVQDMGKALEKIISLMSSSEESWEDPVQIARAALPAREGIIE